MRLIRIVLLLSACLAVTIANPASADRASQLKWFQEARFGMFIHWGLYSMIGRQEWIRYEARIPLDEYQYYADNFNPVDYKPDDWVDLAQEAGMKYMVITSKHHDGYCLFDTKLTDYSVMNSRYGKDVIGMLAESCRKKGMQFGVYYSTPDWHHPDYLPRLEWEQESRPTENADMDRYIGRYVRGQLEELVAAYDPVILWFDLGGLLKIKPEHSELIEKSLRAIKPDILINDRLYYKDYHYGSGAMGPGDFGTPERNVPATGINYPDGSPRVWEVCNSIDYGSWGYDPYAIEQHSATELIRQLIEIVSKGGNLLLNVGPTPEGTIAADQADRLRKIGEWLSVNGEAIYGTSASCFEKLPFFGRCTVKGEKLYLHVMGWPTDGVLRVPGLKTEAEKAYLMVEPKRELPLRRDGNDYLITLPGRAPDEIATVVAVELTGTPEAEPYQITADGDGSVNLPIYLAEIESRHHSFLDHIRGRTFLDNWNNMSDVPVWKFQTAKPGRYQVRIAYGIPRWGGSAFEVEVGGQKFSGSETEWGRTFRYYPKMVTLGNVELPAGEHRASVRLTGFSPNRWKTIRLMGVQLVKAR